MMAALSTLCAIGDEAPEFAKALNNGAEVKMILRIVDADGIPVPDAEIEFGFWNTHSQGGFKNKFYRSDGNGECIVVGRCNGGCVWNMTKDGYYRSHAEWNLSATSAKPKASNGKWQPFGEKRTIRLKKIVSPVNLLCHDYKLLKWPALDEWFGFDFERNAWVRPYGDGAYADVLMRLHQEGAGEVDFSTSLELCFTNNPYAGAYILNKDCESEMKSVYRADTNAIFQARLSYSLKVDEFGRRSGYELLDDSYLVFRTRTRVDSEGNLVSAHYGKVYGRLCFHGGMRAEAVFFNPTPNDTNLEDCYTAERSRLWQRSRDESLQRKKRKSFWPF